MVKKFKEKLIRWLGGVPCPCMPQVTVTHSNLSIVELKVSKIFDKFREPVDENYIKDYLIREIAIKIVNSHLYEYKEETNTNLLTTVEATLLVAVPNSIK